MNELPKLKTYPSPYDGFDLVAFIDRIRQENLDAKKSYIESYIPDEWRKKIRWWFNASLASKCLRWAGYEALGIAGKKPNVKTKRKMEQGTYSHYRLEREFGFISLCKEMYLFDPELHIKGRCDILARNWQTGELFIIDFKTIDNYFFGEIKREGLPDHLKCGNFYVGLSDDMLQVMLYTRMLRQLVRVPEIPIRYGAVIYENKNNPNLRKTALVEYDENLIDKFKEKIQTLEKALDSGKNIDPYLDKTMFVHTICSYNEQCIRGLEALKVQSKKRKNLPLWKIYEIKRQKKAAPPKPASLQMKLFNEEKLDNE